MSDLMSTRRRGLAFALAAPFWAALFLIPYKAAVERADRASVLAALLLSAALFNTLIALAIDRKSALQFDRVAIGTAVLLALATILGNSALGLALPLIGPGMSSVMMKAQVLITPLLSLWFLGERASGRLWAGGGVALLGFTLPQLLQDGPRPTQVGYLWALGAALCFSAMQVLTRRVITRIRTAAVNAARLWLATAALWLLPTSMGGATFDLDPETWQLAIVAGILGPGISRLCLMSALKAITPSTSALVSLTGPIFAFGLAWVFLSTLPSTYDVLGAILVLAGVLWPLLGRLSPRRA